MPLQSAEFKYITDEWLAEWKAANANFRIPDLVPMPRFLYELCWAVVQGDLPLQKCRAALDSTTFASEQNREEMGSVLADTVAHIGQDLTLPGEYHTRLIKMAKWLVESSLVPSRLLQERCEEEFLWESELTKIKAQDLKAKEVRVNTRLLYQQTKFNLLREESEGYAKLVTLLCQDGLDATVESESSGTISTIKSLIGHFDLDPNRVFDIVLECFELHPNNSIFYNLVPLFPKSHAAQILGFKFQYYQRIEVNSLVPSRLFKLAALLVKAKFIDLDTIYAHLLPKDDEAFEHYDAYLTKRVAEANKIGKINLAATGKDLMDDEKQEITVDLFNALDMENEAVTERASEVEKNQCLGLLIGFLSVDDWYHAQILFERLSHMNPVEHIQICEGLFRLIGKTISTVYPVVCQTLQNVGTSLTSGSEDVDSTFASSTQDSAVDLPGELFQMLTAAGPYLHRDSILLQKVCRVLRAYFLSSQETNINSSESTNLRSRDPRLRAKEARVRVQDALGTCLLPSLQLIPANPAVGQEIWELLSLLPYEVRYRLYGEWERDDEQNAMVLAARQIAKLDTRRLLKRLAKENLKQLGRMVAKLAHANPMTVLRTIVHQIEAYKDMIAPVVDAFKYLTQLEYDVLEYVVIERLAYGGREKLKDDGLNLSDWLQSLASFWGHLCKKYPSMELRGLFQYLANQLKRGIGIELVLLQELIQQMANLQYTENMTSEQIDAMAGSETLRYQVTLFGITRNNKALSKSTNRLRDSLLPREEPKLAIPLLILIAQHRSMIVTNADAPHIKMVSEQFDRCHGTLLQYVEFLSSAITPSTTYAQLIPNLDDLVHKYHLDPEVAFLIYRPLMRLFKCSDGPEVFWPGEIFEESNTSNADNESEALSLSNNFVLDLASIKKHVTWSDLLDTVRSMLPTKAWNSLSPDLYATFWGLTLYDLYVPRKRYESEISKQHTAIKALEELSDNSNSAITKRKKDKEKIQELLDRLVGEYENHERHVTSVHRRLSREKDRWWSSCPDTSKINMEFLQRCIYPRCIFSVPDAVYCAKFVNTLHSLGTPFFNTVNHIDVLICKTLQPMICSCTEFEAGRLGRFLYETLKMAYHWKSDESVYERECGNKPGFAVYYRFPNSQRVTFGQFVRVHWKWSGRITRLLVQCLESSEYMEIRNALIILTKISSVFPVTRKTGINLEKRVAKIKGDEREDLKVLATGVAAALASRKSSWVSDEEFGMGYLDLKPTVPPVKSLPGNLGSAPNGSALVVSQSETGARNSSIGSQAVDNPNMTKDQITHTKASDGRLDRPDSASLMKPDLPQQKTRAGSSINGLQDQSTMTSSGVPPKTLGVLKSPDELSKSASEVTSKGALESETRPQLKRAIQTIGKPPKQDVNKDETRPGKSISRAASQPSSTAVTDKDFSAHQSESRQGGSGMLSSTHNGNAISSSVKVPTSSSRMMDSVGIRHSDDSVEVPEVSRTISARSSHSPLPGDSFTKQPRKNSPSEEHERLGKRRKVDTDGKDSDGLEVRTLDKDRNVESRPMDKTLVPDHDRTDNEEPNINKPTEKYLDKSRDRSIDRHDKDHKEKLDRPERIRAEDILEKARDRSMERHGRERSVDRIADRGADRSIDKSRDERNKEERNKTRHSEGSMEKSHVDERFHGQSLPPPPPLPPSYVPQSVGGSRRDEEVDRRAGSSRHMQRLSPRHDEKERRRSEEIVLASHDDAKRRREDEFRERKRDDRDGGISTKAEERDRDKGNALKDDMDSGTTSKRRKIKRDHASTSEASGEYSPAVPPPPPLTGGMSQSFEARERSDRKGGMMQHRAAYMDEQAPRLHGKESLSKINRREAEQIHEREWEEEKRLRAEAKRKHRK